MNILEHRFSPARLRPQYNRFWAHLKGTPLGPSLTHEGQFPLAMELCRAAHRRRSLRHHLFGLGLALFGMELRGAGYSWESRRWMHSTDANETIASTGANTVDFNCYDFFSVSLIGWFWTVAGTVTALVMDFDKYPQINAGGTVVDKLDGTNGVITAPTVAGQAIGNLLYKDIGNNPGEIDLSPGECVQAIVTTTTTAGDGMPLVLGFPRHETFANLSYEIVSS